MAGRTIVLNGQTFAITGVLRDNFQGPGGLFAPDVWLPLERIDRLNLLPRYQQRDSDWLTVVGRWKPGVNRAQVDAELTAIFRQLAADYPETHGKTSAAFYAMADRHPDVRAAGHAREPVSIDES